MGGNDGVSGTGIWWWRMEEPNEALGIALGTVECRETLKEYDWNVLFLLIDGI